MVQLRMESRGVAGSTFSRLLVVVDGSEEGRRAAEFADAWSRAVGARVQLLEMPTDGAAGRNRPAVSAVVDAAADFGADVIVVGCQRRRLAHHRLGLSLQERLARATDLPLLVPSSAPDRCREDDNEGKANAPIDLGSRSVAHV
jgi:nucleotide-binding universal stress UspA family protein